MPSVSWASCGRSNQGLYLFCSSQTNLVTVPRTSPTPSSCPVTVSCSLLTKLSFLYICIGVSLPTFYHPIQTSTPLWSCEVVPPSPKFLWLMLPVLSYVSCVYTVGLLPFSFAAEIIKLSAFVGQCPLSVPQNRHQF